MTSIDLPDSVGWHHHATVGLMIRILRLFVFLENNYSKTKERTANRHLYSKYDPKLKIKNPFRSKNKDLVGIPKRAGVPTFTYFNGLPVELRCRIWGLASNVGRVVEITQPYQIIHRNTVSQFALSNLTFIDGYLLGAPRVNAPVPAVLQACQESRYEALKYYTLTLAMKDVLETGKGSYINLEKDMLYFGNKSNFFQLCVSMQKGVLKGLEGVKHLALGMNALGLEGDLWWFEFERFAGLETVCFLFKEPRFLDLRGERGEIELEDEGVVLPCVVKVTRWRQILTLLEAKVRTLEAAEQGWKKPRFLVRGFKGVTL